MVIKVINVHITEASFRHVLILADGLDYLKSPLRDLKFPACFSIRQAFRQATMTFEKWNWDLFPIFFQFQQQQIALTSPLDSHLEICGI